MAPVRVLFPFVGDSVGGSHISALTLAEALDPRRFEPVIALHDPDGPLAAWLRQKEMPWVKAPTVPYPRLAARWRQAGRLARIIPPLRRMLRHERIELVHTNDMRMHLTWSPPCYWAGVPHLWHQRTITRIQRHRGFARFSAGIAAISAACANSLPAEMRARARVIANPVAPTRPSIKRSSAAAALRAEIHGSGERPVLAFVANLAERKRPLLAVDILASLAEGGIEADLVFIGESHAPFESEIPRRAAEAGVAHRVHLLGPRYPVEPLLAGADVLLAPARREGWGRVLVEAMLVGTPVIASNEGGHKEIVDPDRTGVLVAPDDTAAFAAAARRLITQPEVARRMSEAARADAEARFSVEAHVAAVSELYDALKTVSAGLRSRSHAILS